jgi:hypothetical protein
VLSACAGIAEAQPAAAQASSSARSTFTIFLRALPVGTEQITVARTSAGWTITSDGRLGAPLDVITRNLEVRYDADWKPLSLFIDASTRGQETTLKTVVTGTIARSEINTAGAPADRTDTIDESSILLPNLVFAPYEALAARLHASQPGAKLPVYIAPLSSWLLGAFGIQKSMMILGIGFTIAVCGLSVITLAGLVEWLS